MCAHLSIVFIKNILYWINIVLLLFPACWPNNVHVKDASSYKEIEWRSLHSSHHNDYHTSQDQVSGLQHPYHGTPSLHVLPSAWM